jgi:short-subunit dehydrogenase
MRSSPGRNRHIINVASLSSFGPVPGLALYAATKHAVLGFTGSLQGDLLDAGLPITVHALCPDAADTPLLREHDHEPARRSTGRGPGCSRLTRWPSRPWGCSTRSGSFG